MGHAGRRQDDVHVDARRACSSAATRRSGPENIIWAVEHGHQAAISIHNHCQGIPVTERPPQGMKLDEHEDGPARVEPTATTTTRRSAQKMQHVELTERFKKHDDRSGARLHRRADARAKSSAASTATCRRSSPNAVHRVRRLHRHLPGATA